MSRILLVDDDENLRPALQKTLESMGHQIIAAPHGRAGLEVFLKVPVDIVISDIRMPEMDGLELTRRVKSHRAVPVILITGFAEILETHQAHELGADEFLAKPFERADLTGAVQRCLDALNGKRESAFEEVFCRLALEDFTTGRQIQHNIFARLGDGKFVKIAHQGEDLSVFRVKEYKHKNINYLYLRQEDFRKYVGFNLEVDKNRKDPASAKKRSLINLTTELLQEQARHSGLPAELVDGPRTFVETAVEAVFEDDHVFRIIESINEHASFLYSHSLCVSFYSVLLARSVNWKLPTNSFKIAIAGLLHETGLTELDRSILLKPRIGWSLDEVRRYEAHPTRGAEILGKIKSVPGEVLQIIREHHEKVRGEGFPARLKKSAIHPMAKLVAVADEFCDRVVPGPEGPGMGPRDAIAGMRTLCADKLDPQFFNALVSTFSIPAQGIA